MKHKHAELIKAWADGAEIQYSCNNGIWLDCVEAPAWKLQLQYRIKPEEKKPVVRWLWAFKHKNWQGYDVQQRFMDEQQAITWARNNNYIVKRLDWSRTEFEE